MSTATRPDPRSGSLPGRRTGDVPGRRRGAVLAGEQRGGFDPAGGSPYVSGPDTGDEVASPSGPVERIDDADGIGAIGELVAAMRAMDRAAQRAVSAACRLDVDRVVAEEGMDHQAALRLHTRATRTDVSVVCEAARMLAGMPATANLFELGVLSWGHVRALSAGVRALDGTRRAALDAHLAAHADRLARLDGDGRLGAIDDAIDPHTAPERLADREDADLDARRLILSPRLDGSGTLFGDLDVEGFAAVAGRLEAEADPPSAGPPAGDGAGGMARRDVGGDLDAGRARRLADALVRLCESNGTEDAGTPVRLTLLVDTDQVCDSVAATIRTALATRPARLTRHTRDRLSCDSVTDLIVREGGELLATHRSRSDVTTATRRAVAARDQGCRFPGCQAPVNWCDVHHIVPRAAGGDHHPANLVLLCRRHHTTIHRRGWRQRVTVDGGYEITRRGRAWTTWPRHHHQLPVPARGSPGGAGSPSSGLDLPGAVHPLEPAHPPDGAHPPDAGRPPGTLGRPDRARSPHDPDPPLPF